MAEDERAARLQRFVCSNQTFFCAGIECTENSARVALVSLNYNGTFAASESPGTVAVATLPLGRISPTAIALRDATWDSVENLPTRCPRPGFSHTTRLVVQRTFRPVCRDLLLDSEFPHRRGSARPTRQGSLL